MCLAVAQAILACLKCGWDPKKGTNVLRPELCNNEQEGDVSRHATKENRRQEKSY